MLLYTSDLPENVHFIFHKVLIVVDIFTDVDANIETNSAAMNNGLLLNEISTVSLGPM